MISVHLDSSRTQPRVFVTDAMFRAIHALELPKKSALTALPDTLNKLLLHFVLNLAEATFSRILTLLRKPL